MGQGKSSLAGFATEPQHGFGQPIPFQFPLLKRNRTLDMANINSVRAGTVTLFAPYSLPSPLHST